MKPIIIAGPCAVESEEQIIRIASKLKQLGIDYLRGGAFKPRTNPDDFQGLGELGIEYLIKAKQITGLPIVTELMSIEQVKKYAKDIDIIQVGSMIRIYGKLDSEIYITKTGKLKFIGENKQFAKGNKTFTLTGSMNGKKLMVESLTYNYKTRDNKGNSKKLYGTVSKAR